MCRQNSQTTSGSDNKGRSQGRVGSNPVSSNGQSARPDSVRGDNGQVVLHRHFDFDEMNPEQALSSFLKFVREVKAKQSMLQTTLSELNSASSDILHYAELHDDLGGWQGYDLYKKLRDTRRQRRMCKDEIELLTPVLQWVEESDGAVKKLERVLGEVRKNKTDISQRSYIMRTDVMTRQKEGAS